MVKFATYASGAIWWPNLQLMQVVPSGGQICNWCNWCHVVAKFNPSHGVNFWVRCASGNVFSISAVIKKLKWPIGISKWSGVHNELNGEEICMEQKWNRFRCYCCCKWPEGENIYEFSVWFCSCRNPVPILSHLVCLPGKGGTLGRYQQSRGDTRMCPTLIFCEFLWIWTWTARFHLTSLCWSSCQAASDYTRWFISILSSVRSSMHPFALGEPSKLFFG